MPAAFLLSLVLRASQGSATVAILTTSGLLSQAVVGLEPLQLVLVTLATCFGSLGCRTSTTPGSGSSRAISDSRCRMDSKPGPS